MGGLALRLDLLPCLTHLAIRYAPLQVADNSIRRLLINCNSLEVLMIFVDAEIFNICDAVRHYAVSWYLYGQKLGRPVGGGESDMWTHAETVITKRRHRASKAEATTSRLYDHYAEQSDHVCCYRPNNLP
jgi:hypothetical protein